MWQATCTWLRRALFMALLGKLAGDHVICLVVNRTPEPEYGASVNILRYPISTKSLMIKAKSGIYFDAFRRRIRQKILSKRRFRTVIVCYASKVTSW